MSNATWIEISRMLTTRKTAWAQQEAAAGAPMDPYTGEVTVDAVDRPTRIRICSISPTVRGSSTSSAKTTQTVACINHVFREFVIIVASKVTRRLTADNQGSRMQTTHRRLRKSPCRRLR